jgi:hypothetical protein
MKNQGRGSSLWPNSSDGKPSSAGRETNHTADEKKLSQGLGSASSHM